MFEPVCSRSYCVVQATEHEARRGDVQATDVAPVPQTAQKVEDSLSRFFMR